MKKILIVIFLLIVCAALEIPEDYQWDVGSVQEITLTLRERGYIPSQTSVKISTPDATAKL